MALGIALTRTDWTICIVPDQNKSLFPRET